MVAKKTVTKVTTKKTAVKPKSSVTSKPTVRGGPGVAGKNVSKTARQPGSNDRAYNAHKKAIADARAQYKEIDRLYQDNPLGRLATGNLNKYNKDFAKVEKTLKKLQSNDKSFVKAGYKPQFVSFGTRKKK
jgi:hypothetical protein